MTNVDEDGEVDLGQEPREGVDLTATLTDPDGSLSGQAWQWARSSSRGGPFTDIKENGNSATYRPVNADTGMYLRATVTYTDGHGEWQERPCHLEHQDAVEGIR